MLKTTRFWILVLLMPLIELRRETVCSRRSKKIKQTQLRLLNKWIKLLKQLLTKPGTTNKYGRQKNSLFWTSIFAGSNMNELGELVTGLLPIRIVWQWQVCKSLSRRRRPQWASSLTWYSSNDQHSLSAFITTSSGVFQVTTHWTRSGWPRSRLATLAPWIVSSRTTTSLKWPSVQARWSSLYSLTSNTTTLRLVQLTRTSSLKMSAIYC